PVGNLVAFIPGITGVSPYLDSPDFARFALQRHMNFWHPRRGDRQRIVVEARLYDGQLRQFALGDEHPFAVHDHPLAVKQRATRAEFNFAVGESAAGFNRIGENLAQLHTHLHDRWVLRWTRCSANRVLSVYTRPMRPSPHQKSDRRADYQS